MKENDTFLTKNADGKTVQAITINPFRARASVDLELQRAASRAAWAKKQEEIDKIVVPAHVYGVQKGRKQNMKDNIKKDMDHEIIEDGFEPDAISCPIIISDDETEEEEAVLPVREMPPPTVTSTALLDGIRQTGSETSFHNQQLSSNTPMTEHHDKKRNKKKMQSNLPTIKKRKPSSTVTSAALLDDSEGNELKMIPLKSKLSSFNKKVDIPPQIRKIKNLWTKPLEQGMVSNYKCQYCNQTILVNSYNLKKTCSCRIIKS